MLTNRLFNLIVVLVVILAIQFTSVAVAPAAATINETAASKYEDRYDRMNSLATDLSYIAGKYEQFDRMNDLGDLAYIMGKHETGRLHE